MCFVHFVTNLQYVFIDGNPQCEINTVNQERLATRVSGLESVVQKLFGREITCAELSFFLDHNKETLDLCEATDAFKGRGEEIAQLLDRLESQMNILKEFKKKLNDFWQQCKKAVTGTSSNYIRIGSSCA